ncbi:MAG: hypothetical protein QM783_16810 [Phycisphaerales bacterium]
MNRTTARLTALVSLAAVACLTACKNGTNENGTLQTSTGATSGAAPYTEWKPIGTTTAAQAPAPKAAPTPAPAEKAAPAPAKK